MSTSSSIAWETELKGPILVSFLFLPFWKKDSEKFTQDLEFSSSWFNL